VGLILNYYLLRIMYIMLNRKHTSSIMVFENNEENLLID